MGDKLYLIRKSGSTIPWETYTPSGDSRIVYCDSTRPDDSGDGLSEGAAKKTLAAALALIRDGYPDWLKLKRGCTWDNQNLSIRRSGRSNTERIVVTTYGTGARPVVDSRDSHGVDLGTGSHLAIEGLKLYASKRDPNSPNWDSACSPNGHGVECFYNSPFANITIQDCDIGWYAYGIDGGGPSLSSATNIKFIGNIIHDIWIQTTHGQGIYFAKLGGNSLIEGNVLYSCGWSQDVRDVVPDYGKPSVYNQGLYISHPQDTVIRNNVVISPSNASLKMRSDVHEGGKNLLVERNLFCGGGLTAAISSEALEAETNSHYNETWRQNLHCYTGDHDMPPGWQSWGGIIENIDLCEVYDEIFFDKPIHDPVGSTNRALYLNNAIGGWAHYGTNVHIHDCIVHNWYTTLTPKIYDVASDPESVTIEDNTIDAADEYWVDANRTVATYNRDILGGTLSYAEFATRCMAQTRSTWDVKLEATSVYDYIKAGFTPV